MEEQRRKGGLGKMAAQVSKSVFFRGKVEISRVPLRVGNGMQSPQLSSPVTCLHILILSLGWN